MLTKLKVIDPLNSVTGMTVLGNDTDNLAVSTHAIYGAECVEFDKVDGAANTKVAGFYKTIDVNLKEEEFEAWDKLTWSYYVSATTNIDYMYVQLGSTNANYAEWRFADTSMTTSRWDLAEVEIGDIYSNGTGWDPSNIDYLEMGVVFDAEGNTLADMRVEKLQVVSVTPVRT